MPLLARVIPVLHVTNSAVAEEFYCKQLGFTTAFAVRPGDENSDPCYMGVMREGIELHLSSHAGDGVSGGVVNIRVIDLDELHEELMEKGVTIAVGPLLQTWGLREMYVRDPDGNSIRFQSVTG
jgi:uncharacterized glyoxalase superfamily protein PhnB